MNKQLAKIRKAGLEIKERGILNFWIHVDYEEGCSQGVGGLCLDDWNEDIKSRIGTAYGCEMIRQLLLFFNVNNLNECEGQLVYVLGEGSGLSFSPKGFQHLNIERNKRPERIVFDDIASMFHTKEEK